MSFALTEQDMGSLNEQQKNAIMDSLIMAVLSGGKPQDVVVAKVEDEIKSIPWGVEDDQLEGLVQQGRERVMASKGEEAVLKHLEGIATQITSQDIREKVFRAMLAVMSAEGQFTNGEIKLAVALGTAFQLPRERLDAMKADIVGS